MDFFLSALDGGNGFQITAEGEQDLFGLAVSAAGDLNDDGFGDLVIGAKYQDGFAGAMYVLFGTASGFAADLYASSLNGTDGFEIHGETLFDETGNSVSGAGDVNGDGIDDLVIGAHVRDKTGPNTYANLAGGAYVLFGKTSGFAADVYLSALNGANGFEINGESSYDRSGYSVSEAGDVNGDGFGDLLISAIGIGDFGGAYVVFGKAAGFGANLRLSTLNGANGFQMNGETGASSTGFSASGAGDVNGDGFDDLLVSSPHADNGAGTTYVVFGRATGFAANLDLAALNGENGFEINGASTIENSGLSVSSAGDVNADGYDDILIGAPQPGSSIGTGGLSYVVFGAASGFAPSLDLALLDGTNGFKIQGEKKFDGAGLSVSTAGDVNGDGIDDLLVGAPNRGGTPPISLVLPNGIGGPGSTYLVYGRTTGFEATLDLASLDGTNGFEIKGESLWDGSGVAVSDAGDVNGDGFDDILIGAVHSHFDTPPILSGGYILFGGDFSGLVDSVGTAGDDSLVGGEEADVYVAGSGDDTLEGAGGDDALKGGRDDDWLSGGAGDDRLDGGSGFDIVSYESESAGIEANLLIGRGDGASAGADLLDEIEGVIGTDHADALVGDGEKNLLDGGDGDDTLDGSAGNDTLLGGEGHDTFIDKAGNDTLLGGAGDDTFLVNYGKGAVVTASGEAGSDLYVLNAATPDYTYKVTDFTGGAGGDQIGIAAILDRAAVAGFYAGTDPFASGFIKLVKSGSNTLVKWDLDGAAGTAHSLVTGLTLLNRDPSAITPDNFFALVIGSASAESLGGTDGDDVLLGQGGNDSLGGAEGSDLLFGGIGADTMNGGAGSDTYQVDNANDKIVESSNTPGGLVLPGGGGPGGLDLSGLIDTVIASINYNINTNPLRFIENVQLTGNASKATGNMLANALTGNAGNDTLVGGGGNDTLDGGADNDSLVGGAGDDVYVVNTASDKVKEAAGQGADTVRSSVTRTIDANIESLVLSGNSAINATGNDLNNNLVGNSGKNKLVGNGGNDTLDGGGGADTLEGGAGNDIFVVDSALDKVTDTSGIDTVHALVTRGTLFANVEHLVLAANDNIDGTGNGLGNRITGNRWNNVIDGGAGTDTMIGGDGNDTYILSAASDVVTENADEGVDTVKCAFSFTLGGNVENLVLTGSDHIGGTGDGADNAITGNAGNNELIGDGGDDTLDGGTGDDTMSGGDGDDVYVVNIETDVVQEGEDEGFDTVRTSLSYTLPDHLEGLVLTGTQDRGGTGNGLANLIVGNDGNNFLDGGGGADSLSGGAGIDTLLWDTLDSIIDGGAGEDRLTWYGVGLDADLAGNTVIRNIEIIDIYGDGANSITLDLQAVLDLSSTSNTLRIDGGGDDSVTVTDGAWTEGETAEGYAVYTSGAATLRISTEITDVTIPA